MALKAIPEKEYSMLLYKLAGMPEEGTGKALLEKKLFQVKSRYDRLLEELDTTIREYQALTAKIRKKNFGKHPSAKEFS